MAAFDEQYFKFNEVEEDGAEWVKKCLSTSSTNHVNGLAKKSFSRPQNSKDFLSELLFEAVRIVNRQNKLIANLRGQAQVLKTQTISCQASVIKLQEDLISVKDQQLGALQTAVEDSVKTAVEVTVKTAVEDSVKTELKSYSEAARASLPTSITSTGAVLSQDTLKSVVKHVVEEEDRSRNLMIFGMSEDDSDDEQLNCKVSEVFEELREKPRIEASRLGVKSSNSSKTPRPVKVTLSSSTVVRQILLKARNLRLSEKHRSIFVVPDRCMEQRAEQKKLVLGLKKKKAEEPNKRHYIKGGHICSVDIPVK